MVSVSAVLALEPVPACRVRPWEPDRLFCFQFHEWWLWPSPFASQPSRLASSGCVQGDDPRPGGGLAALRRYRQGVPRGSRCGPLPVSPHPRRSAWALAPSLRGHSRNHRQPAPSAQLEPIIGCQRSTTPGRESGETLADQVAELCGGQNRCATTGRLCDRRHHRAAGEASHQLARYPDRLVSFP